MEFKWQLMWKAAIYGDDIYGNYFNLECVQKEKDMCSILDQTNVPNQCQSSRQYFKRMHSDTRSLIAHVLHFRQVLMHFALLDDIKSQIAKLFDC